jgi:hypothetical protein
MLFFVNIELSASNIKITFYRVFVACKATTLKDGPRIGCFARPHTLLGTALCRSILQNGAV